MATWHSWKATRALGLDDFERHLLGTLVLLTAYNDILRHGECGFFGTLLQTSLAHMTKTSDREKWATKFPIRGEKEEAAIVDLTLQHLPFWNPPVANLAMRRDFLLLARENDQTVWTMKGAVRWPCGEIGLGRYFQHTDGFLVNSDAKAVPEYPPEDLGRIPTTMKIGTACPILYVRCVSMRR